MSIESMAIAMHHSAAKGTARLVVIGIANHDGDGGAWPSVGTLAKYAAVTPRNVQKALDKLEELGEIRRLRGQGGNHETPDHRRPNLYRFLLSCPPECDRTSNHRMPRGVSVATPVDAAPEGVSDATGGVGSDTGTGVGSDTQTILITPLPTVPNSTTVAREADSCQSGHPIIDRTPSGTPFCAYGCEVAA